MNTVHTTSYKLYNEKAKENLKLAIANDLHFSYMVTNEKLFKILNKISDIAPNYILIPGDLINSVDAVQDNAERERLCSWLKEIGSIAPTLVSFGNHDSYTTDSEGNWKYMNNSDFFEKVNDISNINILNNASYNGDNLFVTGITEGYNFYHCDNSEDSKKELISNLNSNIPQNIPEDKINILLVHSPVHMTDPDILEMLKNYDLIVCGHMHNGCVPPVLYELWRSTRGLISPEGNLFPKNVRNTLKYKEDKVLVNGSLTMFGASAGKFCLCNMAYPMYVSAVEFSNNPEYDTNKVLVRRKYK